MKYYKRTVRIAKSNKPCHDYFMDDGKDVYFWASSKWVYNCSSDLFPYANVNLNIVEITKDDLFLEMI